MRKLFNKYEKTMKKLFAKNREPRTRENTTFKKTRTLIGTNTV